MRLIILSAGKGERLMPLTRDTPKPLMELGNGRNLLQEQLRRAEASGAITEAVIVVGYLAHRIEECVAALPEGITVSTLLNPLYESSNNLISLCAAMMHMDKDFMVMNGDNLFDASIFRRLAEESETPGLYLSTVEKTLFDDDDMRVELSGSGVGRVSKALKQAQAESAGLALVKGKQFRTAFMQSLMEVSETAEAKNLFWLEAINHMVRGGTTVTPWFFENDGKWQEIDYPADMEKVRSLVSGA